MFINEEPTIITPRSQNSKQKKRRTSENHKSSGAVLKEKIRDSNKPSNERVKEKLSNTMIEFGESQIRKK